MTKQKVLDRQGWATLIALAIGLGVVVPFHTVFELVTGRSVFAGEPELLLVHSAMVAMPFLILAGKNLYDKVAWATGVALTLPAWVLLLYEGIRYNLSGDNSGVGGAAFLIVLWPILVTLLCVRLGRARSR